MIPELLFLYRLFFISSTSNIKSEVVIDHGHTTDKKQLSGFLLARLLPNFPKSRDIERCVFNFPYLGFAFYSDPAHRGNRKLLDTQGLNLI